MRDDGNESAKQATRPAMPSAPARPISRASARIARPSRRCVPRRGVDESGVVDPGALLVGRLGDELENEHLVDAERARVGAARGRDVPRRAALSTKKAACPRAAGRL